MKDLSINDSNGKINKKLRDLLINKQIQNTIMKIFAENKRAYFDYEILEKFEAGVVLYGFEVKAIKLGKANLAGSFIINKNNEFYLINCHISPYQPKNTPLGYNPIQNRKLLLTKKEIKYLIGKSNEKNLTLLPLRLYTINDLGYGKIKLEFAIAKSKRKYNKRETIKKRDIERSMKRELYF